MKEPKILPNRKIQITIPQKFLRKLFVCKRCLTLKEIRKTEQKSRQIEVAITKLRHARSIVELILCKRG